jgi:hypothetical protein
MGLAWHPDIRQMDGFQKLVLGVETRFRTLR